MNTNLILKLLPCLKENFPKNYDPRNLKRRVLNKILYHQFVQKNKYVFKRLVGHSNFYRIRNLMNSISWNLSRGGGNRIISSGVKLKLSNKTGINILGHITAESGTGEAVRGAIQSIKRAKIPHVLNNFEINVYRKDDRTYTNYSTDNPYGFNLISVNADQADVVHNYLGNKYYEGKYNIGYWVWEQSSFPTEWLDRFKYYNEIWTPSSFTTSSIAKVSPIPVLTIPYALNEHKRIIYNRKHFSIPDEKFVFLFIFDFLSFFERKNPLAVVNAFKRSLVNNKNSMLVLKTVNGQDNLGDMNILKKEIAGSPIVIMDGYFSRDEVSSLINICDCYISLHRSEGFGYTLLEAMQYGKPVIATGYSGNMDFMNVNNGFLVKYKLIELEKDYGPYKKGTIWADPDISHACELMKYVYDNQSKGSFVGNIASIDIISKYSPDLIGKQIQNRLHSIISNSYSIET